MAKTNAFTTLGKNKLTTSGITVAQAKKLGMKELSASQTAKLCSTFDNRPSLYIPYFTHNGKPLSARPKWPQFFRVRYLGEASGFDRITGKARRYSQPAGSGACAYLPSCVNWEEEIFPDNDARLFITEGELKAAKASLNGFPTIGLGGVWNFKNSSFFFLPELDSIPLLKRSVYIVFDSDIRDNPQVCLAVTALSEQLYERGAYPYVTFLPENPDGSKLGLDDYLVMHTNDDFEELVRQSQETTLARYLWQLNNKYCHVQSAGIFDRNLKTQVSFTNFRELHATKNAEERTLKSDGTIKSKPAALGPAWLSWPGKLTADLIDYAPGQEEFFIDEQGQTVINTWKGWGVEPKKGDTRPFLRLLRHLFSKSPEENSLDWFLKWLAYPLQHPMTKNLTCAVLWGMKQGTGKTLVGYTMGQIYGYNFTEISQTDLHFNFNEWARNRQFILGDEVSRSERRQDADVLKKMITQSRVRINAKYVPTYEVNDCANYLFTSNHPDAFYIEDDDRRFFVHEVDVDPLPSSFYHQYDKWLKDPEKRGAAAVFYYLLNYPLGDFNPNHPALGTRAKEMMTGDLRSDLAYFIRELRDNPTLLPTLVSDSDKGREIFTSKEILGMFLIKYPHRHHDSSINKVSREMKRAGFFRVSGGRLFQVIGEAKGSMDKYFPLLNAKKWERAKLHTVRKHLLKYWNKREAGR